MRKFLLTIILSCVFYCSFTQESIDSTDFQPNLTDTLEPVLPNPGNKALVRPDSMKNTDHKTDTLETNTLKTVKTPSMEEDSLGFAIAYLMMLVESDSLSYLADSVKEAIVKIVHRANSKEIESTIEKMEERIGEGDLFFSKESIPVDPSVLEFDDSIELDTIGNYAKDLVLMDSLAADSLNIQFSDSLNAQISDSVNIQTNDSIKLDSIGNPSKDLALMDSLPNDSINTRINDSIEKDSLGIFVADSLMNDTLVFGLQDSVLSFREDSLRMDSLLRAKQDTLVKALQILMNYIKDDSIQISFYNDLKDSIPIWLKDGKYNNIRFRVTDDHGVIVGLRITSANKELVKLDLERGTVVRQIKERERIEPDLALTEPLKTPIKQEKMKLDIGRWDIGSASSMHFNQAHLQNWVQGGESSVSTLSILKFNANYSKSKTKWDNDAEVKLGWIGLVQESSAGGTESSPLEFRKNEDRFELNSKYGKSAFKKYYYTALFNLNSQFLPGYEYPNDSTREAVSKFLSPGYFIFSLGMDYKPSKNFTLMLSPLTSKFTVVVDTADILDHTKYSLAKDEKVKKEIGAYAKSIWKYNITKDIDLENKINLFTNYTKKPLKVDVDWEVTLTAKISQYINARINARLIYDYDVKFEDENGNFVERVQFKEFFSIGFSYTFKNSYVAK